MVIAAPMDGFFDTLESRRLCSAAAPVAVDDAAPLAASVEHATPRARTTGRQLLSVLTFRNNTSEVVTFKSKWHGQAAERHTLKPGAFRLLSTPAQALRASIKFDALTGSGKRMTSIAALPKPFVSGDPTGLVPRNETDGTPYAFSTNAAGRKIKLKANLSLDRAKFAQYRSAVSNDYVPPDRSVIAYPDLGSGFEVLAPSTGRPKTGDGSDYAGYYNCIGWTLGEVNRWIDPITGPEDDRLARMDELYAAQGYRRLKAPDYDVEPGTQKVVLFAMRGNDGGITKVTHAALQSPDGSWSSKMGALALIRHWSPGDIAGLLYGGPVAVYSRAV